MKKFLFGLVVTAFFIVSHVQAQTSIFSGPVLSGSICPPVAPPSVQAAVYTCTGTGALYTWTGAAWVLVAGSGGTIGGTIGIHQVAFATAGDTIGGSSTFTYDPADQVAETPNLQLFNNSSGTQGYLMEVDSTSTAAGSTANYPRMFHSVFNMNGTGTLTGKRVMPASLEVFNSTTGTITWSSSAEVYAENLGNGNWTTMLGIGSRLFNDGVGTVGRMVGFGTSEIDHFQNGNYGGGTVTYYAAFEGTAVNNNGTYGDVYGLRLTDQSGLTVTGNNHAINYNDIFVVDSTGAIYNGINSSKIDDIDSSAYVAPALAGTGAGNVSNGTHRYKFTIENSGATIHTAGGTATSAVTVVNNAVNGKVVVSVPVICFSPTEFSASVRIYRDKDSDGVYKLVGAATQCQRDYVDNIADGSLGVTVPTTNNTEFPIVTFSNASVSAPVNAFYSHTLALANPPNAAATSEFLYYYIFPEDRDTATTPHMGIALFGNQNDVPLGTGMYNTEGGHLVLQGGAESAGGQAFICGGAAFPGTVGAGIYTDSLEGGCITAYGSTATDAGRIEIVSGVAFAGAAANLNGGNITISSGAPANSGHYGDLLVNLWRNVTLSGSGTLTITGGMVAPASSGTRFLCISTAGVITSSASACSGT